MKLGGVMPWLAPFGKIQSHGAREVGLHQLLAALVDDLAAHGIAGVREAVAGRRERAAHTVHAFAQHDFDALGAEVEHLYFQGLAAGSHSYSELVGNHRSMRSVETGRRSARLKRSS